MQLPRLDTLLLGNQFVGIELFSLNGEEAIAQVFVQKKKGELYIENKEMRGDYDHFKIKAEKGNPVFLTINNSQIIQKEIEGVENNDSKLLYKAFPNLKVDDFLYEIWRIETSTVVCICRKNYIEELLKKFGEREISISGITLGVCGISSIKDFVVESKINTNNQSLYFENDTLILNPIENNIVKTYDINGLDVENTYLLSFTSVLQNLLNSNKTTGTIKIFNTELFSNFKQNSFFRKGLKLMVYSLLVLLLVNFFFFNYYFKKANESSTTIVANKSLIEEIKSTKERVKNKEEKLGSNSGYSGVKNSFLINEIVKNIPNSVLLSELTYHPIEKKVKENEKIVFQNDIILISGTTNNPKELTLWFENLEKLNWIKESTILHFGKNEENQTIFTLKLNIDTNEAK